MGSASELDNHILLAHDLNYLSEPCYQRLSSELTQIKRMLTSLTQRVKTEN
jgi:four helix bundle protein